MSRTKKSIAMLLAVILFVTGLLSFTSTSAITLGQQKDQLQSKLDAQKKEQARIQANLAEARKEVNNQLQVLQYIYDEMNSCQDQINTLSELILDYTNLAQAKEEEIDRLNQQMDRNFELFKERLIFAQESGSISYIDFLLGSSDFSDILSRAEVINDMLEYDRKIIESLVADREAVEKAKEEIQIALKNCEEKKKEQEDLSSVLQKRQEEAASLLDSLKGKQNELQKAYDIAANEKKKTEQELDEINKQIAASSANKPAPTGFIWPLPVTTPGYISQYFHSGHSGLDIAVGGWVNNGKIPALAIAAGTVSRVGSYWDWGNLVVVDHGGGYVTYYAHLDSISVSLGQRVSQGQQVGKIGSTGQSTGPHLHLVFYGPTKNGNFDRVDPMHYISYPR